MVMNDTCTTHRSRVPRRSFGRVKWGGTTVETREDQAWNFSLCFVCGSCPWGAAAFHLCFFILLLKCVTCSPVPASFFPYLRTVLQVILHFINTLQYYCFYCIFDKRNIPSWANETSYKNIKKLSYWTGQNMFYLWKTMWLFWTIIN